MCDKKNETDYITIITEGKLTPENEQTLKEIAVEIFKEMTTNETV